MCWNILECAPKTYGASFAIAIILIIILIIASSLWNRGYINASRGWLLLVIYVWLGSQLVLGVYGYTQRDKLRETGKVNYLLN